MRDRPLFNLVIDEWLASLEPRMGFSRGDFTWNAMAFADDLVVAASTPQGLRQLLAGLQVFLAARGLYLTPAKCISLALQPDAKGKKTKILSDTKFSVGRESMPSVDTKAIWRYLGINFNTLGIRATRL